MWEALPRYCRLLLGPPPLRHRRLRARRCVPRSTSCIPVPALTATPPPAPPPPRPAAGHMFQPGFSLASRAVNFAYKGAVFAVIGLGAGLLGTATSNGLLALRKRLDPSFKPRVGRGRGRWDGMAGWQVVEPRRSTPRGCAGYPRPHLNLLLRAPSSPVPRPAPPAPPPAERGPQHRGQRVVLGGAHGRVRQHTLPAHQRFGHGALPAGSPAAGIMPAVLCRWLWWYWRPAVVQLRVPCAASLPLLGWVASGLLCLLSAVSRALQPRPSCCPVPGGPALPHPPTPPSPQVLQPIMPSPLFRLYSSVIRGGNNLAGGVSFVLLAKLLGVQKAAEAAPLPEPVGKGKKTKK